MNGSMAEEAVNTFQSGLLCSQSILLTYGLKYGIDEDTALRLSRAFGSGMGRTCQTCGAVTGAYMVLGLINTDDNEKMAKEATYALIQKFDQRFKALHGDVNCEKILGCNLGNPEGQDWFKKNNLISKCHSAVRDAAVILEDLIINRQNY